MRAVRFLAGALVAVGIAAASAASAASAAPAAPAGAGPAAAEDAGWIIDSFDAQVRIDPDGRLVIDERIDVDFGPLERHGIFREIPVRYEWTAAPRKVRVYEIDVLYVTDGRAPWRYETSRVGANLRIKIGDPDKIVRGKQSYRIGYVVKGALNAFDDHDELFWNVTGGDWPVPIARSSATVRAPAPFTDTTCYVGRERSTARCAAIQPVTNGAAFTTGRALGPGEQLTIVAALPKGVVAAPVPILRDLDREFYEYFDLDPAWLGLAAFVAIAGLTLILWRWLSVGRDDPDRVTLVPEYEPPDGLRPAQVGLIVDERADTLDVTATIVDLAVRGYLTITEIPKEGLFGSKDWLLTRKRADMELQPYEATILTGLFATGDEVKLSDLKEKFYVTLGKAQRELYGDAVARGWFPLDPSRVRTSYVVIGLGLVVLAAGATVGLGYLAGAGIVGLASVVPAVALIAMAPVMPRKSKDGAELARRALGFKHYMEIAETERQRFAEREQIFAEYLPYAIVFRCVDQWAKAFQGIDLRAATSSWYAGSSLAQFGAADMSRDLSSFSHQVSSAIASTPGGSGSSGFSGGGGAGGGGGGGGGGSW